jgi:hypothetical protein
MANESLTLTIMAFAVPVALIIYSQLFITDKVAAHYMQAVLIGLIGLGDGFQSGAEREQEEERSQNGGEAEAGNGDGEEHKDNERGRQRRRNTELVRKHRE